MSKFDDLLTNLPEVRSPQQRRLGFKEKLKWTGITLLIFFGLGHIPLFGLGQNALSRFEFLSLILGARFGSIISLGIGPLVTASIVLQLLNGSGIMKLDLTTHDGKKRFQGLQKLFAIFFVLFEAIIYVFMGGLAPAPEFIGTGLFLQLQLILVFQLFLGGIMIMFMDEIVSKWGFGSGISLFIAAGVSESIFIRAFSPLPSPNNPSIATGAIPAFFQSLAAGDPVNATLMLASVLATVLVFVLAVYAQSMKVEIPLSFGRIRGHGIRWPLSFIYTSNIPVILVAALIANIQLWAKLLDNWGYPILGRFVGNTPESGLVAWLFSPDLVGKAIRGSLTLTDLGQATVYVLFFVAGSIIFSIFWVQTAGMDAKSQAKQMMASGLQIPGFRKDQRVMERLLERYIWPLTIMGAIAVGFLASLADLSGALSNGTGILLAVMIIYKLYEDIAKQHMTDMNPMLRKFMGG
ncbi:preprotein translocase subunit SecY [Candidatus Woesearchaeota archaeon]|nr:preprotein translocase subunit SecY [Candidatus Woesearchaeota archaeon]